MERTVKKRFTYFLLFTLLFTVTWTGVHICLLSTGKSLVWRDDAFSVYYEMLKYRKYLFQNFIADLGNGRFAIPWNNYNLTGDNNLFCLMGLEIFDIPLWFVPATWFEPIFCVMMVLRVYCAGITFSLYCFRMKNSKWYTLLGALLYTFCEYAIYLGLMQPFFVSMLYMTPVIFIGVEDFLEKKKGGLLIGAVAATACINVFLMFYNTIVIGLYCCARVFLTKNEITNKIKKLGGLAAHYLLGLGISAFLFIPTAIGILCSNRMGSMPIPENWLSYGLSYIRDMIRYFFVHVPSWSVGYWGFSVIALFPLIYILIAGRQHRQLQISFIVVIILMNSPWFGYFAGAGQANNRWIYILGFLVAYIVVKITPILLEPRRHPYFCTRIILNIFSVMYIIYLAVCYIRAEKTNENLLWAMICSGIIILYMNVIWKGHVKGQKAFVGLLVIEILSIMAVGYTVYGEKYVERFVDRGDADSELEIYVDAAFTDIDDSDFYRVDKYRYEDELSCNLPYWYGYNGISSFFNVLNPSAVSYYKELENPGIVDMNKLSDLNGRVTDEALSCVKYYLVKKNESERVPYGFRYLQDYSKNDIYAIYVNEYNLPIGFTYDEMIHYDDFHELNIAEKQEIMLKNIVLDTKTDRSGKTILKSRKLDLDILDAKGVIKTEDGWHVSDDNAYLDINIDMESPLIGELYIQLEEVENRRTANCQITVSKGENNIYTTYSHGRREVYTSGMKNFSFNMGVIESGEARLRIAFSMGNLDIKNICAYVRSLNTYENDVEKLKKESLENVVFSTNQIDGDIEVINSKFLCFSIPYSEGWTCYVDGEKVELMPANIMFMAIRLAPGKHHIRLSFAPKGFYLGLILSLISLTLIIFGAILRKNRMVSKG